MQIKLFEWFFNDDDSKQSDFFPGKEASLFALRMLFFRFNQLFGRDSSSLSIGNSYLRLLELRLGCLDQFLVVLCRKFTIKGWWGENFWGLLTDLDFLKVTSSCIECWSGSVTFVWFYSSSLKIITIIQWTICWLQSTGVRLNRVLCRWLFWLHFYFWLKVGLIFVRVLLFWRTSWCSLSVGTVSYKYSETSQ